jgi:hypothetical protein
MKAVKYQKKSLIKLEDLLRRRKTTLKKFLGDRGITNYRMLEDACSRLGVITPSAESFSSCIPSYVSDPAAGVVVIEPLSVVSESTGAREEMNDAFAALPPQTVYEEFLGEELPIDDDELEIVAPVEELENKKNSSYKKKSKKAVGAE